jgi:S-adenosylmethionine decarboxylase
MSGSINYFSGKSYRLGPANHDHVHIFYYSTPERQVEGDVTLEMLMHDMHPAVLGHLCPKKTIRLKHLEKRTGIDKLYTRNGKRQLPVSALRLLAQQDSREKYMTIHVTPEPSGSYASFETNFHEADYTDTINDVASAFSSPNRFTLVMTGSQDEDQVPQDQRLPSEMTGYQCTEKSFYEFDCGYAVSFFNYA